MASRIPVYFVPGLASSHLIFEHIRLPEDVFECIYLTWDLPEKGESLKDYAKRYCRHILHDNPVLIGCSFGGLMVQEMKEFVNPRRVIIISSAKSCREYPRRFKVAKYTKLYKLLPISLLVNIDHLAKYRFNKYINQRLELYHKYLGVREKDYWYWAIDQVINWQRKKSDPDVIHIHGAEDEIFPARYITNYIPVPGGTHIMIITKAKWLSENLPKLILDGKL